MVLFIPVSIDYTFTRASGIKSKLLSNSDYSSLISLESSDDVITYLINNSDYNDSLSQYYTRFNPILSFIKALHFQNAIRWKNITNNMDANYKKIIDRIQQNVDLRNVLLIINLLPNLQNEEKLNLESLFTNLQFGGTISYYNWIELAKDFSLNNFLSKTIFLAPRIHDFLIKIKSNLDPIQLNFLIFETITDITFNDNFNPSNLVSYELLTYDLDLNLLRFLQRYSESLKDQENFEKLKRILTPWKKIKKFIGSEIYNYSQFDQKMIITIISKLISLVRKFDISLPENYVENISSLNKKDLNLFEDLIIKVKILDLKRKSISDNQLAKILLIMMQLILEIENLSWIIFGKTNGLDNDNINEKLFII